MKPTIKTPALVVAQRADDRIINESASALSDAAGLRQQVDLHHHALLPAGRERAQ